MKLYTGKISVAVLALICCLLWGSAFPAIKISYMQLGIKEPFEMIQLAGIRFLLASILVLIFARVFVKTSLRPSKKEWRVIVVIALMQTFGAYAFNYIGMANTTSAKASILSSAEIFFTIVLTHFMFKNDRLTIRKITGLILGLMGIVAVNMTSSGKTVWSFSFNGEGFLLLTSLFVAVAFIIIKKHSEWINMLRINGWQLVLGGILLGIFGYSGSHKVIGFTLESAGLLLYMALLSAVAFSVWFELLKHNRASEVTIYKFALPVFGALLSVIVLPQEQITWLTGFGLTFVAAGIAVSNLSYAKIKKGTEKMRFRHYN